MKQAKPTARSVILASRQYPQGGRVTRVNKSNTTDRIPLSLDGRGPKPVPVPDTGAEGENDATALSTSLRIRFGMTATASHFRVG